MCIFKIFHFGGDEVAHGAWTKSPACKQLAQKLGMNFTSPTIVKDLKEYFVRRVADVSSKYCLDLGAWEDGVLGVKDTPYDRSFLKNKNVYAYAWDNVWEWRQGDRAYKLANADYKVGFFYTKCIEILAGWGNLVFVVVVVVFEGEKQCTVNK